MPQALKKTKAKGSSGQITGKLEKIPAWQLTRVRNTKEVIDESRTKGRGVNFASLMDICHLKNLELEPQCQKYKRRVVLRGDIVKDDPGSCAVFTGTRIVSVTNDSRKSDGHYFKTSRMRRTSSRRSIR